MIRVSAAGPNLSHGSPDVDSTMGGRNPGAAVTAGNHTGKDSWSTALEDKTGAETILDVKLNLVQP